MDQHLGIGMVRAEAVSLGVEFATQFAMVIDFAVEDDPDRPVLVGHRLMAAGKIDDGQPAKAQGAVVIVPVALVVGSAVDDRRGHTARSLARVPQRAKTSQARYSAHISSLRPARDRG